jgi:hypothetical protein
MDTLHSSMAWTCAHAWSMSRTKRVASSLGMQQSYCIAAPVLGQPRIGATNSPNNECSINDQQPD